MTCQDRSVSPLEQDSSGDQVPVDSGVASRAVEGSSDARDNMMRPFDQDEEERKESEEVKD